MSKSQNHKSRTSRDNGMNAEKPPKGIVSNSCDDDESKVINRTKDLPKSQNHKSRTNRGIGISAEKLPKETMPKGCAEEKIKRLRKQRSCQVSIY